MEFGGIDLKGVLQALCTFGAGVSVFAALVFAAVGKWNGGDQGGLGDHRMLAAIMSAAFFSAAGVVVTALNFSYNG